MKRILVLCAASAALTLSACGFIETGDVGVRTQFGAVEKQELGEGFYTALTSSVREFSAKETTLDLENLTPKAKDNLSLKDLDVSVFYQVRPGAVADLYVKYSNQHQRDEHGKWHAGAGVVQRLAKNVIYEEAAKHDSLTMHTKREVMALGIKDTLQRELDATDKGSFVITKVVIRSLVTDSSIELAIQNVVKSQKELEQMTMQTQIATKQAEVEVAKARGIAQANQIINSSLTREYLQHERNEVLKTFANKGGSNTVVLDAGTTAPLLNIGK